MKTYEFKVLPPNSGFRVVRITHAATIEEAIQRVGKLYVYQAHAPKPQLLCTIDEEPQVPLVRFG